MWEANFASSFFAKALRTALASILAVEATAPHEYAVLELEGVTAKHGHKLPDAKTGQQALKRKRAGSSEDEGAEPAPPQTKLWWVLERLER